ncbi:MAG: hypothetical protein PSU94_00580 [Lacunisphaera sp.]|nr:hypothetical protein [Lacunisphaera sp.]
MPATINYSTLQPAKPHPKPIRVRYKRSLEDVWKQAAASVDRKGRILDLGRFNPLPKGRQLTRVEKIFGLFLATTFGLAIWIHARPEPVNAHAGYFQSLALTTGGEASSVQAFTEAAVLAIGKEWKAPVLFARMHPLFWQRTPAIHPNALVQHVEAGLAGLAAHGRVVSVTVFGTPELSTVEQGDGRPAVTSRVTGQLELADGTVVRLEARLIQDEKSKQWGLVDLALPPFLP